MVPAKDSLRVLPAPLDRRKGQEQTQYLQYMIAQLAQEVIGQRGGGKTTAPKSESEVCLHHSG